jgi:elongation factor P
MEKGGEDTRPGRLRQQADAPDRAPADCNSTLASQRIRTDIPRPFSTRKQLHPRRPMANANDLRKGMCLRYNSNPAIVLEVQHRTPGNLRAFVQVIIRYIGTGKSADVRFGSTDKVELVEVERKKLDFSYKDHSGYHFMEPETYETVSFDESFVGDAKDYLTENQRVDVLYVEGKAANIELPSTVILTVKESAEGVKGDSANNVQKPAVLETGKTITVPLFIKEGEKVKISTEDGQYLGRA